MHMLVCVLLFLTMLLRSTFISITRLICHQSPSVQDTRCTYANCPPPTTSNEHHINTRDLLTLVSYGLLAVLITNHNNLGSFKHCKKFQINKRKSFRFLSPNSVLTCFQETLLTPAFDNQLLRFLVLIQHNKYSITVLVSSSRLQHRCFEWKWKHCTNSATSISNFRQ